MKILVVTNSCSERMYQEICEMRKKPLVDPQQKFFRLLIEGLAKNDNCDIEVLSALPVSASTVNRYVFPYRTETTKEKIKYHHIAFLNGRLMRYLTVFVSAYKFMRKWVKDKQAKNTWIIVDPLCPIVAIPSRIVAQKKGIRVLAVITDMPTLATNMKENRESIIKAKFMEFYQKISNKDLTSYDAYIPLTESINEEININQKPFCVVEGFADVTDSEIIDVHSNFIMYAGGIYEKYGVKTLVEAFLELEIEDVELHIFGNGSYVDELLKVCISHPRIKYKGCVLPQDVVAIEKKALLLVNPRPCNEEFAKYSFPSKTMEYLLSGTAVVSTRLPGIPEEYFEHMYVFRDDTKNGIKDTLSDILNQPRARIIDMGRRGHEFVLKEKNNVVMAQKILSLLEKINKKEDN